MTEETLISKRETAIKKSSSNEHKHEVSNLDTYWHYKVKKKTTAERNVWLVNYRQRMTD